MGRGSPGRVNGVHVVVGYRPGMEPIPESESAAHLLGLPQTGDDILGELKHRAALVRVVVPTLVGLSLAALEHGVTLTLVATSQDVAALDGVQYVDDGPCVAGAREDAVLTFEGDSPTDERAWMLFARATAADGVASTLTLPVTDDDRVVGTVNLYASAAHAFDTHHEHLAAIFGAWAEGAVINADLGFETRRSAQLAPQVLRDQVVVDRAVGVLASAGGLGVDEARQRIADAAVRAGVEQVAVAHRIISAFTPDD